MPIGVMLRMQLDGWMDYTGVVLTMFLCMGLNQPLQIKPLLLDLFSKVFIGL